MLFVSGIATGVLAAILFGALLLPLVTGKAGGGGHDWIAELVKEVHTVAVHASELVDATHQQRALYGKVMTVQHGLTADVRNHLATLAAQAAPGLAKAAREAAPIVEDVAKAAPDIAVLAAEIPKGI